MTAENTNNKTTVTIIRNMGTFDLEETHVYPDDPSLISKPAKWPILSTKIAGIRETLPHTGGT